MEKYPSVARTLFEFTYMDDTLTSKPNLEEAVGVAKQCIEICRSINWHLIGFQSNSVELLKALPKHSVKKDVIPLLEEKTDIYVTKVLRCYWNTVDDSFEYKLDENLFIQLAKEFDIKPTKRDQASTVARIYDKLGFISHFTIRGKILLQRSWEQKIGWDDKIDDQSSKDWKKWLQQLNDVSKLKFFRRFTQLNVLKDAKEIQLHLFSDAGKEAYAILHT
jgi:hypothetical protein